VSDAALATVLSVEHLSVRFATRHGIVRAVDDVSFTLDAGETLGLVGESGSGKSVTCLAVMGLLASRTATVEASAIRFEGRDLTRVSPSELRALRGDRIAMVFQDPMTSLNPFLTIGRQLEEVLEEHRKLDRRERRRRAAEALGDVGIASPQDRLAAYPHQMSGGMRQRVMIAMALLCTPRLLLADEPTTALDVTVQAQVLDLFARLRERHGTATLFVTHALGVVAGLADRVNVMYAGRIVETGNVNSIFERARHPYTRGLLASAPTLASDPRAALPSIRGQPPDLARLPIGCAFAPRCDHVAPACDRTRPALEPWSESHSDACLRSAELDR
jgi:oligopeptide transport system ATP-binding protein